MKNQLKTRFLVVEEHKEDTIKFKVEEEEEGQVVTTRLDVELVEVKYLSQQ